jgi:hypothetical protein
MASWGSGQRGLARSRAFAGERQHLTAAAFFALLVLAYLWPVLLGGKILSPISWLYGAWPWKHHAPADIHSYYNPLLSDIPSAVYPWREYARGLIREGTLPAWNPYVFAGAPFYSNPQTGIFSLFSVPLWILPLNYAIGVGAALKLWAAGFGSYLLVRELRLGFLPGLLAGVAYAFCSMNIVWLTHETLPAVAVMLPWMLWLIERLFVRGGGLGPALGLAVATAIALGGGHPSIQLHVLAGAGLYAVVRVALLHDIPAQERWRPLALAGGGLALGALLMGAMLIPEALGSHGTIGTLARKGGHSTLPGSVMPVDAIKTTILPDWWGRPSSIETRLTTEFLATHSTAAAVNYNERTFYAGVVALLLACIGLAGRAGWRRKAPFAALGFVGLAVPLHFPVVYQLVEHLPGLELVQNQRMHFLFEMAAAVLAAFGLQALLERPAGDRTRLALALGGVAVGLVALAVLGPSGAVVRDTLKHFLTGRGFHSNGVLALTSVWWYLLFAAGVAAAVLAARRRPALGSAVGVALVALAIADMLHFAIGYQPMGPASRVIPPRVPAIAFLQRHASEGRITGLEEASIPNDWPMVYRLRDVRGYDPPQPTLRFFHLWQAVNPQQANWTSFTIEGLTPEAVRLFGVLGARYIVAAAGVGLAPGGGPAMRAIHRVYADGDATIFENAMALPRTMVAPAVQLTADEDEARAALVADGFDPRRTVVVERQPGVAGAGDVPAAHGTVRMVRDRSTTLTLQASLDRRGLVVLNDDDTAGWSVRVDGHAARALHVNDVMRGVVVPGGRHEIVWSYAVPGLRAGAVVSVLALGLIVGLATAPAVLRRRRGVRALAGRR